MQGLSVRSPPFQYLSLKEPFEVRHSECGGSWIVERVSFPEGSFRVPVPYLSHCSSVLNVNVMERLNQKQHREGKGPFGLPFPGQQLPGGKSWGQQLEKPSHIMRTAKNKCTYPVPC